MTAGMPLRGSPAEAAEAVYPDEAELARGFAGSPVKFVVFAILHYAGRAADLIVSLYSRAFRLDRTYVAGFNKSTGVAHARHGRWRKAIPLLEKALAMDPDDRETRTLLARAYGASNDHERARFHLEKVVEAAPDSAPAVRALGGLCLRRRDYDRAIELLEGAVKLDPGNAQSHYHLGVAYDNKELYERAVESFTEALRLNPDYAKAYQALGFTRESMGDRESAVRCFKKALELE